MVKTTQVAADRAHDETETVLPTEVAQGVYISHAPSLAALKIMHLMIGTAAGRMADDVRHEFRLSDIKNIDGMDNHTRKSIVPLFQELAAAVLTVDDPVKMTTTIGGLMDGAKVDYRHEVSGDVLVTWYFGRTFREVAAESNHWAILDRQAVFHFTSKFSVLLFQHISSLTKLKHITSKRFSVPELRAMLGVPEGKFARFSNLKKDAIEAAITEINSDLTRLHLTATYHKIGRTVAEVEIAWEVKEDLTKVKAEQDRPKAGRQARRDGTVKIPFVLKFPENGDIRHLLPWDTWAGIHCNHDYGKVAAGFRSFCKDRSIKLDAKNIEELFINFCKSLPKL